MRKARFNLLIPVLLMAASAFAVEFTNGRQSIQMVDANGNQLQKTVLIVDGMEYPIPVISRNPPSTATHRETEILWTRFDEAGIASNVGLSGDGELAFTGWTLNNRRFEAFLTFGDGNPLWVDSVQTHTDGAHLRSSTTAGLIMGATYNYVNRYYTDGQIAWTYDSGTDYSIADMSVAPNGEFTALALNETANLEDHRLLVLDADQNERWHVDLNAEDNYLMQHVVISADNQIIALTTYTRVYVFDAASGQIQFETDFYGQTAPAISADGAVLVTGDFNGYANVYLWRDETYQRLWRYRFRRDTARTNWVTAVAVSADGQRIAAGTLDFIPGGYQGQIAVFDTPNPYPIWTDIHQGDYVEGLCFNTEGSLLVAGNWGEYGAPQDQIRVYNGDTGELFFSESVPGSIFSLDLADDGQYAIFGGKHVHAREWGNGGDVYLLRLDPGGGTIQGTAYVPNGEDPHGITIQVLGTSRYTQTRADGSFTMRYIPAGTWDIQASKPGYTFEFQRDIDVAENDIIENLDFELSVVENPPQNLLATDDAFLDHILLSWEDGEGQLSPQRQQQIQTVLGVHQPPEKKIQAMRGLQRAQIGWDQTREPFRDIQTPLYYAIYRSSLPDGPYFLLDLAATTETTYADSLDLFPQTPYYYRVTAVYETGESPYSNEDSGTLNDDYIEFEIEVPLTYTVPTFDGIIDTTEWADAYEFDITDVFGFFEGRLDPPGTVTAKIKVDDVQNQLYLAVANRADQHLTDGDQVGLYFDDNGDGHYPAPDWDLKEGNFWVRHYASGADSVHFRAWHDQGYNETITLPITDVGISDQAGYVAYEVALPLGFMQPEQLQVFLPEQMPRLWLFVSNAETGDFNGYWPQPVENWRDPQNFGQIHVPVTLDAPPQAPGNLTLTPVGTAQFRLTWTDPTLDRANAPLMNLEGIHIFRNYDLWQTVPPGTESVIDAEVLPYRWYTYQLKAFNSSGYLSPYSPAVSDWVYQAPEFTEISYDDGSAEGFYVASFNFDDNKFAVRCTPAVEPSYIGKIAVFVSDTTPFEVAIYSHRSGLPDEIIAGPYPIRLTEDGPGWAEAIIPGDDPPSVSSDFWVVMHWSETSPGAPGVGGDRDQLRNRSYYYLNSVGWRASTQQNYLMRAYTYTQDPVPVEHPATTVSTPEKPAFSLYPNPFNANIGFSFALPDGSPVTISIYDIKGALVKILVDKFYPSGYYRINWSGMAETGETLPSGIYTVMFSTPHYQQHTKIILLK
ncbi:MAG: T9SS C-terminal target domain-containing protein [Gemmatimonadetes bacterium]|nr:MAG: T9SS C-terminal target domain-containing protein [Gemmatimonadota bacterium]